MTAIFTCWEVTAVCNIHNKFDHRGVFTSKTHDAI